MTGSSDPRGSDPPGAAPRLDPDPAPTCTDLAELLQAPEASWRRRATSIRVVSEPATESCPVRLSPAGCEQVLGGLVAAVSAVLPGATVRLSTRTVAADPDDAARLGLAFPGRWGVLVANLPGGDPRSVDQAEGPGVPRGADPGWEIAARLGAVRALVRSSGGAVRLRQEPSGGVTLELYMPAPVERYPAAVRSAGAAETILVVEDERPVRELVRDVLRLQGYTVLEAADGEEALAIAGRYPGPIDLVVADVVVPGPAAAELVERLRTAHPGLRALYTSGYTGEQVGRLLRSEGLLLEKPFSVDELVRAVRQVLEAPGPVNDSGPCGRSPAAPGA